MCDLPADLQQPTVTNTFRCRSVNRLFHSVCTQSKIIPTLQDTRSHYANFRSHILQYTFFYIQSLICSHQLHSFESRACEFGSISSELMSQSASLAFHQRLGQSDQTGLRSVWDQKTSYIIQKKTFPGQIYFIPNLIYAYSHIAEIMIHSEG